jgi:flagellar biosynthesis/type III secretory pathway chaperone
MQGLLGCLNLERESLVNLNVHSLWTLMKEKDELLASITRTDQEIHAAEARGRDAVVEGGDLPKEVRQAVQGLSREIRRLKMEIRARVRENVAFIQETLRFFDEIVSLLASGSRADLSYDPHPKRSMGSTSLLYEREV